MILFTIGVTIMAMVAAAEAGRQRAIRIRQAAFYQRWIRLIEARTRLHKRIENINRTRHLGTSRPPARRTVDV